MNHKLKIPGTESGYINTVKDVFGALVAYFEKKNVTKRMKISSCAATQNRGISALDNQAYRTGAFRQSQEDGVSSTQV